MACLSEGYFYELGEGAFSKFYTQAWISVQGVAGGT